MILWRAGVGEHTKQQQLASKVFFLTFGHDSHIRLCSGASEAYLKNILIIFSPSYLMTNAVVDFYLVSSAVIISVIFDNSALPL